MDGSSRAVLVTGAARGLARGIAADLAGNGWRVAFTFRPGGTLPDETALAIAGRGTEGFAIAADHACAGQSAAAVEAAQAHFGRLDALVHAVGPMLVRGFARTAPEDWRAMFAANFESALEASAAILPGMREREFGRLIFFGMNGSHATHPARGLSLYGASKAALVFFARTLALEEARFGITVNTIEPGDIRDKTAGREAARTIQAKNPTGHAGSWEDVAYAVRALLADEASFLNGVALSVNGGMVEPHE